MVIKINKEDLPIKESRKLKLLNIYNQEVDKNQFGYRFRINYDVPDEGLEDFHLFCVSIVGDLLENKFKTNETGIIGYDVSEINIDLNEIKKLYKLIKDKKYER